MVSGATGTVGSALAEELALRGRPAKLLLRPGSSSPVPPGKEHVEADLDDTTALARALRGVRALFVLTPLSRDQHVRQRTLISLALSAGVRRIVKLSALGADERSTVTVHREHGITDSMLTRGGVSHVILRPNAFMQNTAQWKSGIQRRGTIELPMHEAKVSLVDARDVARSACQALLYPEDSYGAYDLTGPESLSYSDIAERISLHTGTRVRYANVSPERAAVNMRADGAPAWAITRRLELYGSIRAGRAETITQDVARLTGVDPIGFGDFLDAESPLGDRS